MPTRRKLLLADDSPTVQKVVSLTFGDEGMEVVTVGGGREALAELEREVPDIVLADVHMPAPGGYDLCARIKADERTRRVPVMLLVGSFEPFDISEARRVGADEVLTKPFQSIRELVNKVGGLLGGHPESAPSAATDDETRDDAPGERREPAQGPRAASDVDAAAGHDAVAAGAPPPAFADFDLDDGGIESSSPEEFTARRQTVEDAPLEDEPAAARAAAEDDFLLLDADEPAAAHADFETTLTAEPAGGRSFAAAAGPEAPRAYAPSFETRAAAAAAADDSLLELGDVEPPRALPATEADEFVLDIDDESAGPGPAPRAAAFDAVPVVPEATPLEQSAAFDAAASFDQSVPFEEFSLDSAEAGVASEPEVTPENLSSAWEPPLVSPQADTERVLDAAPAFADPAAVSGGESEAVSEGEPAGRSADARAEFAQAELASAVAPAVAASAGAERAPAAQSAPQAGGADLSPEAVDAIARRVVELMSDRVVREVAWEVVPELSERLIRRRLEEGK